MRNSKCPPILSQGHGQYCWKKQSDRYHQKAYSAKFSARATIVGEGPAMFTLGAGRAVGIHMYSLSPAIPIFLLLCLSTPDKTVFCR